MTAFGNPAVEQAFEAVPAPMPQAAGAEAAHPGDGRRDRRRRRDRRTLFPRHLRFEGNRAIVFHAGDAVPRDVLRFCVAQALTYHERRRRGGGR